MIPVWSIVESEDILSIVLACLSIIHIPVECSFLPLKKKIPLNFWISILHLSISICIVFIVLPEFTNVTICNSYTAECLYRHRALFSSTQPPAGSHAFSHSKNQKAIGLKCDCLPECEEIRYAPRYSLANRLTSPNSDKPNAPMPK